MTGPRGETVQIVLRFEADRATAASAWTDGCRVCRRCGSMAAELALGATSEAVAAITADAVLDALGPDAALSRECADLAVGALQTALWDFMRKREAGGWRWPAPVATV